MEWEEIGCVLVVVAHPDDAEFGCSGTVAKLTNEGKKVYYALTTDGSKGSADPEMTPERLTCMRKEEQREAGRILGLSDIAFLDFPDGMLEPTLDLRRAISATIRRFKPDIVICQNPVRDLSAGLFVAHPDHLATGEACFSAVYPCARDRMTFPELLQQGLEPHAVKELWISGTPAPDYYIDITSTMDVKVRALQAHDSQVGSRDVEQFVSDRARQVGEAKGFQYAEAFRRIVIP